MDDEIKANGETVSKIEALESGYDRLKEELDMERTCIRMAVLRLGGMVEGAPTHRLNFLQRIDALVTAERSLAEARAERDEWARKYGTAHADAANAEAERNDFNSHIAATQERLASYGITCGADGSLVVGVDRLAEALAEARAELERLRKGVEADDALRAGHPGMCCGQCHDTLAAAIRERDAAERELAREMPALRSRVEALTGALSFAACVIKSGEPWTETCERTIGAALAGSASPGEVGP